MGRTGLLRRTNARCMCCVVVALATSWVSRSSQQTLLRKLSALRASSRFQLQLPTADSLLIDLSLPAFNRCQSLLKMADTTKQFSAILTHLCPHKGNFTRYVLNCCCKPDYRLGRLVVFIQKRPSSSRRDTYSRANCGSNDFNQCCLLRTN